MPAANFQLMLEKENHYERPLGFWMGPRMD